MANNGISTNFAPQLREMPREAERKVLKVMNKEKITIRLRKIVGAKTLLVATILILSTTICIIVRAINGMDVANSKIMLAIFSLALSLLIIVATTIQLAWNKTKIVTAKKEIVTANSIKVARNGAFSSEFSGYFSTITAKFQDIGRIATANSIHHKDNKEYIKNKLNTFINN